MNAPLYPEVLLRHHDNPQPLLPLATDGVARWVWESRFGSMLIEAVGGDIFVNGQRVVAYSPGPPAASRVESFPTPAASA